ncbi:MAG: D-alanine--poly(phosphoribitol) ligase [Bacteroidetes bacterium]|nr:MAG: D-alanine--poly(phosphoribitol) ligase [Bacteroidota bacterium]
MKFSFTQKDFIELNDNPEKLAVSGDDFDLSWDAFSERVNQLCHFLQEEQLTELEKPVIIYGHKSANMLVAVYAMIKLQIPYIPIDIVYPKERVVKIRSIAQSELILNTTETPLDIAVCTEIMLSQQETRLLQKFPVSYRKKLPDDPLIYLIFTSGSTGEPKGVQISTEAVQSFTRWMTSDFGFHSDDVFMNTAVLSFDLSVFEVMTFGALGASIILNNKNCYADPDLLMDRVQRYQGSVWVSTPSFALIYSRMKEEKRLQSLKTFLFCGEVLPHDLAKNLLNNYSHAKVINTYGPTEATVATTIIEIDQDIIDRYNPLPVGYSKPESHLVVEDEEIIIVGPNVSTGYLNAPELNQQKFTNIDGLRAFRTGDQGYLEDGLLFFNGRNDDLVKLHGYRIELNEISRAINDLDYVLHGETIALKRGGIVKKIVSLVKLSKNEEQKGLDLKQIKQDLSLTLPPYMIPSDILFVEEIPLNQNGKADKKQLLERYLRR